MVVQDWLEPLGDKDRARASMLRVSRVMTRF